MINGRLLYAGDVDENTTLYRYMNLNQFISFVELEKIYFTRITKWEDIWEAPIRFIPRKDSSGKMRMANFNFEDTIYGQCWSRKKDSDALWRIYCRKNDGIMIQTTAKKFNLIENFRRAVLGEVKYYKDTQLKEAVDGLRTDKNYGPFDSVFLKRDSFDHELEVRIVVCQQDFHDIFSMDCDYINFKIDVKDFIDGIYVDPRSDNWFVESIRKYCKRKDIQAEVVRSELYIPNVFDKNKFYIEYKEI